MLNAIFKQINNGDNTTAEPADKNSEEYKEWLAWKALKGISVVEARKKYVDCLSQEVGDWNTPSPRL
jgi:acyl-CoA-binding protein